MKNPRLKQSQIWETSDGKRFTDTEGMFAKDRAFDHEANKMFRDWCSIGGTDKEFNLACRLINMRIKLVKMNG